MEWFRWFEGTANDPKFHVVARKSGQPVAFVVAVWAMLLERASAAKERGCIEGFDCESADAVMGMPDGAACEIVQAMKDKNLIDGASVCRWAERQPKREDGSAERAKEWRERNKGTVNATERTRTQPNAREDKIREEKNIRPPLPPTGGEVRVEPAPTRKAKTPTAYSADFEGFWQHYPRKIGKDAAWKVYQRRKHEIPTGENMAAILARHSQTEQWQREGGQYIPHPATWLNGGRWADDVNSGGQMQPDPVGW